MNLLDGHVPPNGQCDGKRNGDGVQYLREVHVEQQVDGPRVFKFAPSFFW